MESKFLKPISQELYLQKVTTSIESCDCNYLEHFKPFLENINTNILGPYYWFIPDHTTMKLIATSESIRQLTPYVNFDINNSQINNLQSFVDIIHLDDKNYVLSAMQFVIENAEKISSEKLKNVKFNIYGRIKNAQNIYIWVVIQFPAFYINKRVESMIVLVTDLSHLNLLGTPLLTISDYSNEKHQFFKIMTDTKRVISINIPKITKREKDIIHLMAKGFTSLEIAKILFISYSTVENHRKNLRTKTKTKTSVELFNFIVLNNLL